MDSLLEMHLQYAMRSLSTSPVFWRSAQARAHLMNVDDEELRVIVLMREGPIRDLVEKRLVEVVEKWRRFV